MGLRSQEPERINRLRTAHAARLTFAERLLQFAEDFFPAGTWKAAGSEDEVLMIGVLRTFYQNILADLWAILVLSERGLPTSALTRELLENVISVAYIAKGDLHDLNVLAGLGSADRTKRLVSSAERARLCRDYLWIREERDVGARLYSHDAVTVEECVSACLFLGNDRSEEMVRWKDTWAGCSLEEMAAQAALPDQLRNSVLAYFNSRAVHALDADWKELVGAADGKAIEPSVPERVEWHLLLACAGALAVLEILGRKLGVNRQAELVMLNGEIETLGRGPGPARTGTQGREKVDD